MHLGSHLVGQGTKATNSDPLVSIIIPYYNQQLFIAETVLSAKRQTYPRTEIIVVDDGSPVPAEPYLRGIDGFQLFRTENKGCPSTRNFGFARSSGEYLVFLDGDDLLIPTAIEAHLRELRQHPEAALTFGSTRFIDEHGKQLRPAHICRPRKDYFLMLLEANPICSPGATMIRRDAFIEAGLFDERLKVQVDDYDLYLRLARKGRMTQHNSCVLDYRQHSTNVSRDRETMLAGALAVLDRIDDQELLTPFQRRRLRSGRSRWVDMCRPQKSIAYGLRTRYYKFRSMFNVPLWAYYDEIRTSLR